MLDSEPREILSKRGVRDADDIYELTVAAVEKLWARGCDLVILACNTLLRIQL